MKIIQNLQQTGHANTVSQTTRFSPREPAAELGRSALDGWGNGVTRGSAGRATTMARFRIRRGPLRIEVDPPHELIGGFLTMEAGARVCGEILDGIRRVREGSLAGMGEGGMPMNSKSGRTGCRHWSPATTAAARICGARYHWRSSRKSSPRGTGRCNDDRAVPNLGEEVPCIPVCFSLRS